MAMETERDIDWTGSGKFSPDSESEPASEAPEKPLKRKPGRPKGSPAMGGRPRTVAPPEPVERVPVEGWVSDVLYEALGTILVVGGRLAGIAPDRALLLRFTGEEKDGLRAPTVAVLEKHAGKLGPYQEETALAIALLAVLIKKAEAVKAPSIDYGTIPTSSERPQ